MKLSKKLLALGLSVGLVVSAAVPAFAAEIDPINVARNKVFATIKKTSYTASEKAEIMAFAEDLVDSWDDSIHTANTLWVYANGVKVYVHLGDTSYIDKTVDGHTFTKDEIENPNKYPYTTIQMSFGDWYKYHKEEADQYYAEMKSDFNTLAHMLKFDSRTARDGYDMIFYLYKGNTNVTDIDDYVASWRMSNLIGANWSIEGSLLPGLRDALAYAATSDPNGSSNGNGSSNNNGNGSKNGANGANGSTIICLVPGCTLTDHTNCTTTTTTTTTTTGGTTTTTGGSTTTTTTGGTTGTTGGTTGGTTTTTVKANGLPLANTSTNYGNVMALGLGAMVVALGVFAYSKKITA